MAASHSEKRRERARETHGRGAADARRARPRAASPLVRLDGFCERHAGRLVAGMIAVYALVYLILAAIKWRYFLYKDFDLAIFVQAMEGILKGRAFGSIRGMAWVGDHSSLVLVLLAPLWLIARHPFTLLAAQTLALALGAWPVYRIARRVLPPGSLPVAAAALYLMYPALGYSNLFEFHPETFATPALLATFDALLAGRLAATLLWATLALSCREDVALPVLGLALVAIASRPRRVAFAAGLVVLAAASLLVTFAWLKPAFNAGEAEYGRMYATFGATPGEIVRHILTHPFQALRALWDSPGNPGDTLAKRQYPLHLLLPLMGLPLAAPLALVPALPVLLEHLWSERRPQHAIAFQYTALITPFVVAAGVLGLARAARWAGLAPPDARAADAAAVKPAPPSRSRAAALALLVLAFAIGSNVMFGPVVGRQILQRVPRNESITPTEYDRTLRPFRERMLARVPRAGGVVAGFEFLSRLARRPDIYSIHHLLTGRYTYSQRPYPIPTGVVALVSDMAAQISNLRLDSGERMRRLIASNDLHPVDAAGSIVLFLRGARDTLDLVRFEPPRPDSLAAFVVEDQLAFFDADSLPARVPRDGRLTVRTRWKRVGPATMNFIMNLQVFREGDFTLARVGRNRPIGYGLLSFGDWPRDSMLVETLYLDVSTRLTPGRYRLAMMPGAIDSTGRQRPSKVRLRVPVENGQVVDLGAFDVVDSAR